MPTIQMKATEQFFPPMLFIMRYKLVLTFEFVDEILKCDHSNKSYWAVLSCGAVYYTVQGDSNFLVCGWNPSCDHSNESYTEQYVPVVLFIMLYGVVLIWTKPLSVTIQMKATEQSFLVQLFIMLNKVVLSFEVLDQILNCDRSKW